MLLLERVEGDRHTYTVKNILPKEDPTAGMGDEVAMSSSKETPIYGPFWTLNLIVILRPNTEKTVVKIEVQVLMGKTA
jgi:hypothetical protein